VTVKGTLKVIRSLYRPGYCEINIPVATDAVELDNRSSLSCLQEERPNDFKCTMGSKMKGHCNTKCGEEGNKARIRWLYQ
jgi:hypothetical protein